LHKITNMNDKPDPWSRLLSSRVKRICASLLCEYADCFANDFSEFRFAKSSGPNILWATDETFTILLGADCSSFSVQQYHNFIMSLDAQYKMETVIDIEIMPDTYKDKAIYCWTNLHDLLNLSISNRQILAVDQDFWWLMTPSKLNIISHNIWNDWFNSI